MAIYEILTVNLRQQVSNLPEMAVISLIRTPERLSIFRDRFADSTGDILCIPGVDGATLSTPELIKRGLLHSSASTWPLGQIGCAISHMRCHLYCIRSGKPLVIFEDDAIAAPGWRLRLQLLLQEAPADWDMLLLGWNLDSCLQLEWSAGITSTSLCNPRYLDSEKMLSALTSVNQRSWFRLHKALGLAGYIVSPRGAERLLSWAWPLRTLPIEVQDLPLRICFSFDGQLNSLYPKINAWVCFPPLVLGQNNKKISLTE